MKKIIEINNIKEIENEWNMLADPINDKAYLTYKFHFVIYITFRLRKLFLRQYRRMNLIYFCLIEESEISLIFPLIIDGNNNTISFASEYSGCGYNDIIGNKSLNKDDILCILEYLQNSYPGYTISLKEILKSSILVDTLKAKTSTECYSLTCTEGFDSWFKSLSRHTRGSISTAYNRCHKKQFNLAFHYCDKLKISFIFKIYRMYKKHLREIGNENSFSYLKYAIDWIKSYITVMFQPMFVGINIINREKVAYLTIDEKLVAFALIFEENGGIIIPKCAYDTKYKFYSPGSINFVETIKYLTNINNNYIFDFSKGYHEYKVKYGCKVYENYSIEIN